jgi:hypothetical protein
MIWVLMSGREKRGISLVVQLHDGEPVDVRQNGSNGGADRCGSAYILDPVEHSVWLLYFSRSVLYSQKLKFPVFWDLTSCQLKLLQTFRRNVVLAFQGQVKHIYIYIYIYISPVISRKMYFSAPLPETQTSNGCTSYLGFSQ